MVKLVVGGSVINIDGSTTLAAWGATMVLLSTGPTPSSLLLTTYLLRFLQIQKKRLMLVISPSLIPVCSLTVWGVQNTH